MIVSHAAQPALVLRPVANTSRPRARGQSKGQAQVNVAALYRRALIRTELLLTIAAAPRPAGG